MTERPAFPPAFLASEYPPMPPEKARFHVIPAGLESSVSYGHGTGQGPRAILAASQQLETFDGISEPGALGILTTPEIETDSGAERVINHIQERVAAALASGACPIVLGGEHTVSLGAFRALAERRSPVGIIQFDAHADLRDTYQGSHLSHACVMRRALELNLPICQIAVRSLSPDDRACRAANSEQIIAFDARELHRAGVSAISLPQDFPQEVYLTFDVDGLDPSLMPATGTPEPGGLFWHEALDIIEHLLHGRRLIGADVVELAPIEGLHHPDMTAARLVYSLMGYAAR